MKVNSTVMLELNKKQMGILKNQYTTTLAKIITSQLSAQEIDQLIERLTLNGTLLIKSKQSEFTEQII